MQVFMAIHIEHFLISFLNFVMAFVDILVYFRNYICYHIGILGVCMKIIANCHIELIVDEIW